MVVYNIMCIRRLNAGKVFKQTTSCTSPSCPSRPRRPRLRLPLSPGIMPCLLCLLPWIRRPLGHLCIHCLPYTLLHLWLRPWHLPTHTRRSIAFHFINPTECLPLRRYLCVSLLRLLNIPRLRFPPRIRQPCINLQLLYPPQISNLFLNARRIGSRLLEPLMPLWRDLDVAVVRLARWAEDAPGAGCAGDSRG